MQGRRTVEGMLGETVPDNRGCGSGLPPEVACTLAPVPGALAATFPGL